MTVHGHDERKATATAVGPAAPAVGAEKPRRVPLAGASLPVWPAGVADTGDNASLASVVGAGYAMPEGLSPSDWARFSAYSFMQFNAWEYFFYQFHDGSIPKELWAGADATFKDMVRTKPGLGRFWAEARISFDEPFRSIVDREFDASPVAGQPGAPAPQATGLHT